MATLLDRIRFDSAIESGALERLKLLDFAGCREALVDLAEALHLGLPAGESREVVMLLHDVLQRVDAQIQLLQANPSNAVRKARLKLVQEFAACLTAEAARRQFLASLERILTPMQAGAGAPHPLVQQAQDHIQKNYRDRVYLSAVARALNVSPNYLSRLFRRETEMTLTTYIQRVRLEHARRLLGDGGRRISEIAYLVGYQNYRDFYRNFVKYEKASPREMQRRLHAARRKSVDSA